MISEISPFRANVRGRVVHASIAGLGDGLPAPAKELAHELYRVERRLMVARSQRPHLEGELRHNQERLGLARDGKTNSGATLAQLQALVPRLEKLVAGDRQAIANHEAEIETLEKRGAELDAAIALARPQLATD